MGESQGPAGETVGTEHERTPEQVRDEIEHTRVELGDTVAELAAKADVKAQAHRAIDNAKTTVREKASEVKSKAGAKRDEITASAREATPPSAEVARREVISRAQQHRVALVAVAAFGVGMVLGRRRS